MTRIVEKIDLHAWEGRFFQTTATPRTMKKRELRANKLIGTLHATFAPAKKFGLRETGKVDDATFWELTALSPPGVDWVPKNRT